MNGKYVGTRVSRKKVTTTKEPRTAALLHCEHTCDRETREYVHAFIKNMLQAKRIPLKENALIFYLSCAVSAYVRKGQKGLDECITVQSFNMSIDVRAVDIVSTDCVKNGAILARLQAYFAGMGIKVHCDGANYHCNIPRAFDMAKMRVQVDSILRGNELNS